MPEAIDHEEIFYRRNIRARLGSFFGRYQAFWMISPFWFSLSCAAIGLAAALTAMISDLKHSTLIVDRTDSFIQQMADGGPRWISEERSEFLGFACSVALSGTNPCKSLYERSGKEASVETRGHDDKPNLTQQRQPEPARQESEESGLEYACESKELPYEGLIRVCLAKNGEKDPTAVRYIRLKNVSYLTAFNWLIVLTFGFPLALYFAFKSLQSFPKVVGKMQKHKMFFDETLRAPTKHPVIAVVDSAWKRATVIGLGTFLIGFIVVFTDYWDVVHTPYCLSNQSCREWFYDTESDQGKEELQSLDQDYLFAPHEVDFSREYDWSVSAIFPKLYNKHTQYGDLLKRFGLEAQPGEDPRKPAKDLLKGAASSSKPSGDKISLKIAGAIVTAPSLFFNWTFSALVYFVLALETGILLGYFGSVLGGAYTIQQISTGRKFTLRVIPDVCSTDERRGFQHFAPFIHGVILTTIAGYFCIYLMRIQNLFLRNHDYESSWLYMTRDIVNPVDQIFSGIPHLFGNTGLNGHEQSAAFQNLESLAFSFYDLGKIFDPGLSDTQAYLGLLLLMVVFIIVTFTAVAVLRHLASFARTTAMDAVDHDGFAATLKGLHGLNEDVVRERLTSMRVWPLAWVGERRFLKLIGLGVVFLVFYRLWILWLAALVLRLAQGKGLGRDHELPPDTTNGSGGQAASEAINPNGSVAGDTGKTT